MKVDVLVAEIGSTTTVVNAFKDLDSENPVFWAQGQAPTSVLEGDVRIGLQGAVDDLKAKMGIDELEYDEMLATSSAAGGLKMTVHGLVYDMTAKAAREAALGAGGIIHNITVGRLRRTDLAKIKEINPNLILIAGGVDFGERDTAIYNAELIRSMGLKTPVVYAGNIENQEEMKLIFDEESGQRLYLVDNVYPKIDTLNVEPCRKVIQEAFEDNITKAPGMEHVRDMVNGPIIPTPGAVMECTKLLYDCLGEVMTIDVGGATTDVHAVSEDSEAIARVLIAPEPKAKRTVEGDLGLYVNRYKVIESIGEEKLRKECDEKLHIDLDDTLSTYVAIPKKENEFKLVERLCQEATLKAVERHAGSIRYVYGPSGRTTVAEGKDLTQIKYIVGTGGALTRLPHRVDIMEMIPKDNETGMKLYPSDAVKILVDNYYIMASLGVLSKTHRQGAIKLLGQSLGMELKERHQDIEKDKFIKELQSMAKAAHDKQEELQQHIKEMEDMGYDLTEYKESLKGNIGGATKEEVEAAKREALMNDRSMKKATDALAETFNAPNTAGMTPSQAYKAAQEAVMGVDKHHEGGAAEEEVDYNPNETKPGCDHKCKTCYRTHCRWRNTDYED
ncbi:MAG: glutamate mutase L [Firmicutes bacterium]|nr:glutamate mutase L [Bacillota bacterium]